MTTPPPPPPPELTHRHTHTNILTKQVFLNVIGSTYSKTCVKQPLSKIPKFGFQDQLSPNAGQKYFTMLQGEHSVILLTFIKLPFVIKIFVLSVFEWPFYTGFSVLICMFYLQFQRC